MLTVAFERCCWLCCDAELRSSICFHCFPIVFELTLLFLSFSAPGQTTRMVVTYKEVALDTPSTISRGNADNTGTFDKFIKTRSLHWVSSATLFATFRTPFILWDTLPRQVITALFSLCLSSLLCYMHNATLAKGKLTRLSWQFVTAVKQGAGPAPRGCYYQPTPPLAYVWQYPFIRLMWL